MGDDKAAVNRGGRRPISAWKVRPALKVTFVPWRTWDSRQPRLGILLGQAGVAGADHWRRSRGCYSSIFEYKFTFLAMTDHHLITFALDSVEALMAPQKQPKVLLFDIGGVCVSITFLVSH